MCYNDRHLFDARLPVALQMCRSIYYVITYSGQGSYTVPLIHFLRKDIDLKDVCLVLRQ
jgi:hypothetical protein